MYDHRPLAEYALGQENASEEFKSAFADTFQFLLLLVVLRSSYIQTSPLFLQIIVVDDGIDEPVCRYLAPPSDKFQKAVDKWTQADFMQTQYFPRGSIFVIVLLSAKSV